MTVLELAPVPPDRPDWLASGHEVPRGTSPATVPEEPPPPPEPGEEDVDSPDPIAFIPRARLSEREIVPRGKRDAELDLERSVLGSILIDGPAIADVLEHVSAEDFSTPEHRAIFAAMVDCYARGIRPDNVSLAASMGTAADPAYLGELVRVTPSSVQASQYARLVAAAARRRRIAEASARIVEAARGGAGEDELGRCIAALETIVATTATAASPELVRVADVLPSETHDVWQVEGLLRPGSLAVLASAEGIGKSYARLELAVRLATGTGAVFGHYGIPAAGDVVLIDEENGPDEETRREAIVLDSLGLSRADLGDHYRRVSFAGMALTRPDRQRWLRGLLEPIRPDLVILDTATAMVGDEWGAELKEAVRYLRGLIRDLGCSVLVTVHLTKPPRDHGSAGGSNRHGFALSDVMGQWTRSADVVAIMADLGAGRARWTVRKRVPPSQLILAQRGGLWEAVAVAEDHATASIDDRMIRAIAAGATSADEVRTALGTGSKPLAQRTFYDALGRLRRDGFVAEGTPLALTEAGEEAAG
jgi:hypothetical protein